MPHTLLLTFSSSICDEETRSAQSKYGVGETWISAMLSWSMELSIMIHSGHCQATSFCTQSYDRISLCALLHTYQYWISPLNIHAIMHTFE